MAVEVHDWSVRCGPQGSLRDWNDSVRAHVADAMFDAKERDGFAGSIATRTLGGLRLTAVEINACRVAQKSARAPLSDNRRFSLHHIRNGRLNFEQGNQLVTADPGDFVLIDNFQGFQLETAEGVRCVSIDLSEAWLKRQLPDPFACLMKKADRTKIWAAPFGMMLSSIADTNDMASLARHNLIADQTGSFIALLFDDRAQRAGTHRGRLGQHILEVLREHHADPEITPASIARHVGISKRSLHQILAAAGTTFGAEISRLRMEQARKLLADKAYAPLKISEIAWLCGYLDASYFTRCFSRLEGRSPRIFRLEASGPTSCD
ncbi:helix-turn-helix domain-containing protein [Sphingobium sp.]|uniref:helix-turn-helix domain-containing protein n=1 Tax=Sphingobium sp. TaxID=1912891 RepID=UPI0028BEAB69|nr:helix-turn-helix domain-containing protein [Sphingobium sp.]